MEPELSYHEQKLLYVIIDSKPKHHFRLMKIKLHVISDPNFRAKDSASYSMLKSEKVQRIF